MNETAPVCTYLIIAVTCVFSYLGFKSRAVEEKYIFNPESILAWKEYYRLVTSAFLHSGWYHLGLNMLSLFWFGPMVELVFGKATLLLVYFGAVIGGDLLSLYIHRHHEYYSYGASGGVCGLLFAYVLMSPFGRISIFFTPFAMPGWLYAICFLILSFFAMKDHNRGNIGHDAHLGGAIVGFLILAALHPALVQVNLWAFLLILIPAILMLVYVWVNPLFLPTTAFFSPSIAKGRRSPSRSKQAPQRQEIDSILDKIAKKGIDSLSAEEKKVLNEVSGKYQRREQTKKPESGLAI